ncbi:hypothetical protein [Deinococcus hopiensis]|uniref:Uncharacterized protein n=1 Tax=Deinococcus hopiensis KR-140 TaxID=695939 RepID=A0A1W1U9K4_9DEIO|nr:hypothetical protein [Deinococcus hopiensis]SMB77720.1 hypothetical protein SAMN00790413_03878 [Deinococcus hopiensis KR-140]
MLLFAFLVGIAVATVPLASFVSKGPGELEQILHHHAGLIILASASAVFGIP